MSCICPRCESVALTAMDSSKPLRFLFRCDRCATRFTLEVDVYRDHPLDGIEQLHSWTRRLVRQDAPSR